MSDPDRDLIRWTADARVGDLLPEPFQGPGGNHALIERLAELGVMPQPVPGELVAEVAPRACAAARAWLAAHPE